MRTLNTVDLFCGAGGASTGLQQACEQLGMRNSELAINHWKVAVQTFTANHPGAEVLETDLERVVPEEVAKSRVIDLLWASPSCTHHSRAKGGKPRANQLRAQPELVLSWLDQLFVRRVIIENVPEIIEWGPLNGHRLVYRADAGNVPRPVHAQKINLEARAVKFFQPRHNPAHGVCGKRLFPKYRRGADVRKVKTAVNALPFRKPEKVAFRLASGLLGPRNLPASGADGLQEKAFARGGVPVIRAIQNSPFHAVILRLNRGNPRMEAVPFLRRNRRARLTQHAGGNRVGVVTPFVVRLNNHCDVCDVKNPLPAVATSGGHYMLATPFVMDFFKNGEARQATDPMGAQTTHDRFSLVSPMVLDMSHPGDNDDAARVRPATEPMRTATARNNAAVATPLLDGGRIVDVFIRMFKPREVARVHSFPENYELCGNRSEQMKQLGNSVPVATAKAMCLAALSA